MRVGVRVRVRVKIWGWELGPGDRVRVRDRGGGADQHRERHSLVDVHGTPHAPLQLQAGGTAAAVAAVAAERVGGRQQLHMRRHLPWCIT